MIGVGHERAFDQMQWEREHLEQELQKARSWIGCAVTVLGHQQLEAVQAEYRRMSAEARGELAEGSRKTDDVH